MTGSRPRPGDLSQAAKAFIRVSDRSSPATTASCPRIRASASAMARSRSGVVSGSAGVGAASVKCEYSPDSSMLAKKAES